MSDSQTLEVVSNQLPHSNAKFERSQRLSDEEVRNGEVPSQADQSGGEEIKRTSSTGGKTKANGLKKLFGSLRIRKGGKEGERKREEHFTFESAQILESKRPHSDFPNILVEEKSVTKTQQIFDDKRSRREQRRSLQESGDFLGVQGANPRTGYWDVSDATSSSEPSQMSEETKLRLLQQAKDLAEQEKKFEEARVSHEKELEIFQDLKEVKKKEREEQKKLELRRRQWRRGKWRVSENGWSSVAEPELSPIQQSVAGSPIAGEFPC